MSTVSNPRDTVTSLRRRPAKTATNARTSRAIFGEMNVKALDIPAFIDMYNHHMNGVDNADQLRCYYSTQRVHYKSWKPLWHFLLDTTITNCYKIHRCTPERLNQPRIQYSQREFRVRLANQLFELSERIGGYAIPIRASLASRVHPASRRDHDILERMGDGVKVCVPCLLAGRVVPKPAQIRKPLQELSANSVRPADSANRKRRRRTPRGIHGCKLCGIYICNYIACWNEHLAAIPNG